MRYMLCRNRVADYTKWRNIFDSHTEAHREAELRLRHLWRNIDDPNNVFFLFEVNDIKKAQAFVNAPEAAQTGREAGVLEGDVYFLDAEDID
jgi:hypothetical protein